MSETRPPLRQRVRAALTFRAKRPPHAFVLTRNRLVYVGRDPGAPRPAPGGTPTPLRVASRPLPPETLRPGPAGIALVAPEPFRRVVAALAADVGGRIASASLAIPDEFVRVVVVDLEDPEESPREAEEVLLWKFAKIFGEPTPGLRSAWQTAGAGPEGTRVLAMATLEETAAALEGGFAASGIRIGALESAAVAVSSLAGRLVSGGGFIVWADGDAATTVFLEAGRLRFLRTKATSDPEEALQEIRLAATFVGGAAAGEETGVDVTAACAAGPVGSPIVARFRAFRAERGGTDPAAITRAAIAPEAVVLSERPGAAATLAGVEDPAVLVALGAMAGGEP